MQSLRNAPIQGKRVFYRPDYNVPLAKGVIQDDYRIQATFPTLDYLMAQDCRIIIGTHLGRPDGHPSDEFDLRPVAERLADQYPEHTVMYAHQTFAPEVEHAVHKLKGGDILLLPNLRFHPEEEANVDGFAKHLANLAEVYVNDAFACDHRAHASIVGIAQYLPSYPGLLLEKELEQLGAILHSPASPFMVIMGGAKVSDKIEVIRRLGEKADLLLIGGAMANTFLLAKGEPIGESKAEPDKKHLAEDLLQDFGDKIVLPLDYVKDGEGEQFRNLDLGSETVSLFRERLSMAKTIFWNGSLGYAEDPHYAKATEAIAKFIGSLSGVTSVVAGGDTVETVTKLKLHDRFSFVSTGGGAALEFLAGQELPGVKALELAQSRTK